MHGTQCAPNGTWVPMGPNGAPMEPRGPWPRGPNDRSLARAHSAVDRENLLFLHWDPIWGCGRDLESESACREQSTSWVRISAPSSAPGGGTRIEAPGHKKIPRGSERPRFQAHESLKPWHPTTLRSFKVDLLEQDLFYNRTMFTHFHYLKKLLKLRTFFTPYFFVHFY